MGDFIGDFVSNFIAAKLLQPQIAIKLQPNRCNFEHARNFVQLRGDKVANKIARVNGPLKCISGLFVSFKNRLYIK